MPLDFTLVNVTDDNGSLTTGTPFNQAWVSALKAAIEAALNVNRCVAYHNTTQSIPDTTETSASLNSEDTDVGGLHSTVTNNSRITIGITGFYHLAARVFFAANASGARSMYLKKNGSTYPAQVSPGFAANNTFVLGEVSADVELTAGDYIELRVLQSSGGALDIGSASRHLSTELRVTMLNG